MVWLSPHYGRMGYFVVAVQNGGNFLIIFWYVLCFCTTILLARCETASYPIHSLPVLYFPYFDCQMFD